MESYITEKSKVNEIIEKIKEFEIYSLLYEASLLREKHRGKKIELCAIVNAKGGLCSEDCIFCAQSSRYKTNALVFPLIKKEEIIEKVKEAKTHKVKRFSIVISGRKPSQLEFKKIGEYIEVIRSLGLHACASLGLIGYDEICYLRDRGLERIHCNIETSENFFRKICTTHSFSDKVKTLEAAKKAGLSICSGGIFGIGESWNDRVQMAEFLNNLNVDSVPINFLTPIRGTPMESRQPLNPIEALKIISLFRLMLPDKDIRVCGGRPLLKQFASWIFLAGANALMTGNYLTTKGISYIEDLSFIEAHGLEVDSVVC